MAWNPMSCPQAQTVSPSATGLWYYLAIALLVSGLGTVAASAQEEILPDPAVRAPLAGRTLLLDAAAADGSFVVVGGRGHILTSTDNGSSWQQSEVPSRGALTGVYFHDRDLGWAVGHDSVILRTSDGGTTWVLVNWAPEEENPLLDVWFSDADNGFAIGAYGSFYRTSDGGETWTELPSPYEGSFFGTLPLDGDAVLVFGLQGHLFRSEDAGESWAPVETGTTAMLTDGIRLADGEIVISGLGGTVLVSSDGGSTFELRSQPDRRGVSAIVEAGDGQLLMVGEFGVKMMGKGDLAR